jgi:Ca-activated chloride channel homolog
MPDMLFLRFPAALFLLLLVPFFLILEIRFRAWQKKQQTAFAENQFHPLLRVRAPGGGAWALACWLGAWGALVLALARPVWVAPEEAPGGGAGFSLFFVLDASQSMQAEDAPPTRLRAAKQFLLKLSQALPECPAGLIVFEGEAQAACPPTRDQWALGQALAGVHAHALSRKGSELESALELARTKLTGRRGTGPAAVVVVSDGEMNRPGNPAAAGGRLAAAHIPVFCLGVGTAAGAGIPVGQDFWGKPLYRQHAGRRVLTRLEPAVLQRLALTGQGSYAALSGDPDPQLRRLAAQLRRHPWLAPARTPPAALRRAESGGRELYPWGIWLAAAGLLLPGLYGRKRGAP